ncbi:hypothetical protein Esti_005183 [Eimeria stiedai]
MPGGYRLRYNSKEGHLHLALAVPLCPFYLALQQQQQQQQRVKGPTWVLMMQTLRGTRAPLARIGEFRQPLKEDAEFWVEAQGSPKGWGVQLVGTLVSHKAHRCCCCEGDSYSSSSSSSSGYAQIQGSKRRIGVDPEEAPALVDQELFRHHKKLKQQQQQKGVSLHLHLSKETEAMPSLADQLLGKESQQQQQRPPPLNQQQQQQQQQQEAVRAGDVYRLPSGVEVTILSVSGKRVAGGGPSGGPAGAPPTASRGSNVTIQYRGVLAKTHRCFDKGKLSFCVGAGEIIRGLELGLQGSLEGEVRSIFIPSYLAYGRRGAPPGIPPNADLIFECTCTRIDF